MNIAKIIHLAPDEEILEVLHEHAFFHIPKIFVFVLWLLVPFLLLFPLFELGVMGIAVFFLFLFSGIWFGLHALKTWSQTLFVITDRRIVDVDQRGLFHRVVSEVPLSRIDQVTVERSGLLPTFLKLGVVVVTTAGKASDLEFRHVRQAEQVASLLNELSDLHEEDYAA